ncbi:MAG TPA: DUF1343 domain-containing protein [Gemmatimonadaceae bacterium]|nr:DUF1343 domain-containing protein [Gemmatimonadaceae bacterium]
MTAHRPRTVVASLVAGNAPVALALLLACAPSGESSKTDSPAAVPAQATVAAGVIPGIEVLLTDSMHLIRGKRVGLITNHSGKNRAGTSTIDLLYKAPDVKLTALFGPEHGLRGAAQAGAEIVSTVDSATGVPIYSLFGKTQVPTPDMLKNVDVLLYDIQDVGARVYTYEWTMALSADAAKKPFIVLDRPNPIRADIVEGGVLDPKFKSFVGQYPVALRYGFTSGELMNYLVGTKQVNAQLTVVPMKGYKRSMWWEDTGLPWVNPSPNLRDMDATILYTGTVFFEGTNATEGRGTDKPFRLIGAKWMTDVGDIVRDLNAKKLAGVKFDSTTRPVEAGFKFGGDTIPMIELTVTDRNAVKPVDVGAHLLRAIYKRHARDWQWNKSHIDRLFGSERLRLAVEKEGGIEALLPTVAQEAAQFREQSSRYWIYQ